MSRMAAFEPAMAVASSDREVPLRPRRRAASSKRVDPRRTPDRPATGVAWVFGVAVLGAAWLVPETLSAVGLGWIAALSIVYALRAGRGYRWAYVAGVAGHIVGFHWVYRTVMVFGGFGAPAALAVFALFASLGALQFLAIAVIHRHLDRVLDAMALRSATAVVLAELLMPRLFPWHFGHTQIAFTPMVQVAGIGGAMAVSFVVFWTAEAVVRVVAFGERRRSFLLPAAAFGLSLAYGLATMTHFHKPRGRAQEVVIAQSHEPRSGPEDLAAARRNAARLFEMSRSSAHAGTLVVWPEGAVPVYLPAGLGEVGVPARLPCPGDGSAYLVGGYSYLPDERKFNTAFAVYPDGKVPSPYFKRVLIPFGEYMPLASYIPALGRLNKKAGVFSAGTESKVFEYPMHGADGVSYSLKVSPLICYEDTVPALARQAAREGAELLVNITSDAWFGRSLAPHQHHVIAAFRAIENRRYLLRSTTTGLSAIVDPLGRTIARIRPFTADVARTTVRLLDEATPYTAWIGDRPWWGLLGLSLALAVARRVRRLG